MAQQTTHALGLEFDLSEKGFGLRSCSYAILVEELEVKATNIEEGGPSTISGADEILKSLGQICFCLLRLWRCSSVSRVSLLVVHFTILSK